MKIEIYKVEKRKQNCPIISQLYDDHSYKRCLKCKYFFNGECITEKYEVKEFKKGSEDDEDDPYGGMPFTDY